MAKYLENDVFADLENVTQLKLSQFPVNTTEISQKNQMELFNSKEEIPSTFQRINDQQIAGFLLIKDILFNPALFIQFTEPRTIYIQGNDSVNLILSLFLAAGIVSSIVVYFTFERQVLSRLAKLITSLTAIRRKNNWTDRVSIIGQDELTSLGSEINRMLDTREAMDEAAKRSQERYRAVVESQIELISRLQPDGRYNFVNQAYCKYYGRTEKQIIGSNFNKFFSKTTWKELQQRFKTLTPENPIVSAEENILSPTGEELWQQWINKGIFDHNGKLIEIQSVGRDITERKKVEFELEHRLKLERLLIEISTSFINLDAASIDKGINSALEQIGKFAKVDRNYVFLIRPENPQFIDNTHQWCAPGIKSETALMQNIKIDAYPWMIDKLLKFNNIYIPNVTELPSEAHKEKELFLSQSIQSLVYYPMIVEGKLIGFIGLDSVKKVRVWSEEILTILESAAVTIANAIDRLQHESEIYLRQSHLTNLNAITLTAIEGINYIDVVSILILRLPDLINADGSFITLWGEDGENIISKGIRQLRGKMSKPITLNEAQNNSLRSYCQFKDILYTQDFDNTSKEFLKIAEFLQANALIGLPLLSGEQGLGTAFILFDQPHHFTSQEIDICKQAANHLSLVILKIRALETAHRRAEELEVLRANIMDISSELDVSILLQSVLDRAVNLMNASGGDLGLYDEKEKFLRVVACKNMGKDYNNTIIELGEGAFGKVAQSHEPILIDDYNQWEGRSQKYKTTLIHAAINVPILIGSKLLGVISLFHSDPKRRFKDSDQYLLNLFAQQAAIAVDNAHLFQEVKRLARTDELTGLLNRHALEEFGKYEIFRMWRKKQPVALAMLDVDDFKKINDTYGHAIGDQVLKALANVVQKNLRNIDILGRYGGDEFIILMPETDTSSAQIAAERVRMNIEQTPISTEIGMLNTTASIGITISQDSTVNLDTLQKQADKAMYTAKNSGGNAIRFSQSK